MGSTMKNILQCCCISKLEELGVHYLIPAVQNERIKRTVEENEARSVIRYRMRSTSARKGLLFKLTTDKNNQ